MRTFRGLRRGGLIALAAGLAALLSLGGAVPAAAEPSVFDIHGVVTFKEVPQRGVKVWADDGALSTITDANGRYELHGVPEGAWLYAGPTQPGAAFLDTSWPRYPKNGPDSSLTGGGVDSTNAASAMDFDLWAALSGTVRADLGRAVPNARVCIEGTDTCGVSGPRGSFVLATYVPRGGTLELVATARGYRSTRLTTASNEVTITLTSLHPPRLATAKPKLVGAKKVGKKLRVVRGSWGPGSLHFSYRWYRNGHRIAGAAKSTYRLTWADWRKNITVKVVATKPGYRKAVRTSRGTGWIRWSEWHRG